MASSSLSRSWKYDVFLSFRGEDTRNGFVSHLHKELDRMGLTTFMDEPKIRRGHAIAPELLNAINESRLSVVIISENYASSHWVLDELLAILECRKRIEQIVVPIFYNVDPSDVKKQRKSFGEAFEKHERNFEERRETFKSAGNLDEAEEDFKANMKKMRRWRKALTKVAKIKGEDSRNRNESKLIQQICEEILKRLTFMLPCDSNNLVGMDSHKKEMLGLLKLTSKRVRMVGIWGMGGIGKTTIAESMYEELKSQFDLNCIVYNVKKVFKERNLSGVQELLLSRLFQKEEGKIISAGVASNVIKERVCYKRVLIVLDDVDHLEQLNALAGETSWFGPGSRIIITARDKQLLIAHGVKHVYQVMYLGDDEARQLFNQYAFKQTRRLGGLEKLSNRAVKLAGGLPLALKTLGSYLCGMNEVEWESALCGLESIPHRDIMDVLRTSYDSLDRHTKAIFLHAACFFRGCMDIKAEKILDACGYQTKTGLRILTQRSLINDVSHLGMVGQPVIRMHDLVQQMGRELVRQQTSGGPGTYKMLWDPEDIHQVLTSNTGTDAIEGIILNMSKITEWNVDHRAFKQMSNLKFLKFYDDWKDLDEPNYRSRLNFPKGLKYLPDTINYLRWDACPLRAFPLKFRPASLVELVMTDSHLERLWEGIQPLGKLKEMDLSYSKHLKEIPDLSKATNLKRLDLSFCESLVSVPTLVPSLQTLDLTGCSKLEGLKVSEAMNSLDSLVLNCSKNNILPDKLSCLKGLESFTVQGMQQIPSSITCLTNLDHLHLEGREDEPDGMCSYCPPLSSLRKLTELWLINLKIQKVPNDLSRLQNLSNLDLTGNDFDVLPESFKDLSRLDSLCLKNCKRLKALPELPQNLVQICANGCTSLERIHVDSIPNKSVFINCFKLEKHKPECSAQVIAESMARKGIEGIIPKINKEHIPYANQKIVCLPGSGVPEWFGPKSGISGICLPWPCSIRDTVGFVSCLAFPSEAGNVSALYETGLFGVRCQYRFISQSDARDVCSGVSNTDLNFCFLDTNIQGDHLLVCYWDFRDGKWDARSDHINVDATYDQVWFNFCFEGSLRGSPFSKVKHFGVQLLFRKPKEARNRHTITRNDKRKRTV